MQSQQKFFNIYIYYKELSEFTKKTSKKKKENSVWKMDKSFE